ncbi:MAG: hypothetical protein ACLGI6_16435, partial [Gammaproteobacteria bacterium]
MRKLGLAVLSAVISQFAHGAVTQRVVEAEAFASGTTTADMLASAGSAVSRSSTGTYAWWVTNTADLSTGTYSVYARVALAPGVTGPKSFGPQIYYGGNLVTTASAGITNKAFRWIRITSFDLAQIGGELRIADWSEAGLLVDKLAIVKDVAVQAELVSGAGATIVTETAAQGGRAITRSTSGIYQYWIAPQTDLAPGDYDVLVRLKSASGTRTFTGIVALD